jgi:hypothetical protein
MQSHSALQRPRPTDPLSRTVSYRTVVVIALLRFAEQRDLLTVSIQ